MPLELPRLAALSGLTEDEVARCQRAGIIEAAAGGAYPDIELLKLQLVREVAQHTGDLDRVIDKYLEVGFPLGFLEMCLPTSVELTDRTYRELSQGLGIPDEEMQAVLRAAGLAMVDWDTPVRSDELQAFEAYAAIRALPIPIEARLHALRVTGEAMRRVSEVLGESFRNYVVDPLLEAYREDLGKANEVIGEISTRSNQLVNSLVITLFQRYLEHETVKSVTERMENAVTGGSLVAGRVRDPSVAFVDMVGYTVFSGDSGDREAADLAQRFSDRLVDVVQLFGGRVVKTMGDGAMLFFENGHEAVAACLRLQRELQAAEFPPLRVGINRGPVVAQGGDVYGTTINVAARITDYARPREVLLAANVLPDGGEAIDLEEIGDVTLKGVALPVRLLRARELRASDTSRLG